MTISLASALQTAALAATEDELNEAADELAHIVLAVGVVAFIHGVGKIAKGARGAGKGGASEAQPKPMPEEAKPRPRQSRPVSGPAKPVESPTPEQRLTSNAATALENSRYGGVKAVRVRPGVSDKIAVIGRSMDDAVGPYAKGLQEKGLNVETFSTKKISQGAKDEWAMLKEKYAPERIPEDVIPDTRMFQENQAWARKLKDQGYTVVDVGNPGRQRKH